VIAPSARAAGIAGMIAGAGLLVEFGFFIASGWQPETFAEPAAALEFLAARGGYLRAAGVAGALNLVFTVVFLAGLASLLRQAPTSAAAVLYLGLIGVAGHALVPLGLWVAPQAFAGHEPAAAQAAWAAFAVSMEAAGGVGYLFLGLSMAAAGYAGLACRVLPRLLAWLTLLAGTATVILVLGAGTRLEPLATAAFLPSIVLTITFRVWAGSVLFARSRGDGASAAGGSAAPTTS
jgi:hypothetical protein